MALALLAALALAASGCGEEAGVSDGAAVRVYVSVPLSGPRAAAGRESCAAARRALEQRGGEAGDLTLRATCLNSAAGGKGPWNLATVGANARQAVEDSTTVAYIGEQAPAATRFSAPILEAAEIAQLPATSPNATTSSINRVLESLVANPSTPRQSTFESISGS